jgi:hypothetical protein
MGPDVVNHIGRRHVPFLLAHDAQRVPLQVRQPGPAPARVIAALRGRASLLLSLACVLRAARATTYEGAAAGLRAWAGGGEGH